MKGSAEIQCGRCGNAIFTLNGAYDERARQDLRTARETHEQQCQGGA